MPRLNSAFALAKNCHPCRTEGSLINSLASFAAFTSFTRANAFHFEASARE